ncbi:MAG: hypothetical protein HY645_01515 [Acidobacteria bacterium]|nr:hypothetical protein [Acidobacteriota bacterium]
MYHYDPEQALTELSEEHTLPNPVKLRDTVFRIHPQGKVAVDINHNLQAYFKEWNTAAARARSILEALIKN